MKVNLSDTLADQLLEYMEDAPDGSELAILRADIKAKRAGNRQMRGVELTAAIQVLEDRIDSIGRDRVIIENTADRVLRCHLESIVPKLEAMRDRQVAAERAGEQ